MGRAEPTIAHVDAELGFSGGEKQVFLLIEGLRRAGLSNVLFCPPDSVSETRAVRLGIECVRVPMRNQMDGAAVVRLRRGFAKAGADLVHLHTSRATWLGGWAARLAGSAGFLEHFRRILDRRKCSKLLFLRNFVVVNWFNLLGNCAN